MDYLNRVNLALILLVGGLCVHQWSGEKEADAQIVELRRIARVDETRLTSQSDAIRAANEDIDEFKKVISALKTKSEAGDAQSREQKGQIFRLEQAAQQHATESDVWKKTLGAYQEAVSARDKNITLLLEQRDRILEANKANAKKATDAVVAYNELATKYEDVVGKYNELAARYKAEHTPAPSAAARPSS